MNRLSSKITAEQRMRHIEVIWTDGPDGNIEHLDQHGVSCKDAEEVLQAPIATDLSRSSGRAIAFGFTRHGRKLAVVYEKIDSITYIRSPLTK